MFFSKCSNSLKIIIPPRLIDSEQFWRESHSSGLPQHPTHDARLQQAPRAPAAECQCPGSSPEGSAPSGQSPGPRSPRQGAGRLLDLSLSSSSSPERLPPQAAQHTHQRERGTCFAVEKAFSQLLHPHQGPGPDGAVTMENSFEDGTGRRRRGSSRTCPTSVMAKTAFAGDRAVAEKNHQQVQNALSILIVIETNQNQLPVCSVLWIQ